jgi:hypothetical protein
LQLKGSSPGTLFEEAEGSQVKGSKAEDRAKDDSNRAKGEGEGEQLRDTDGGCGGFDALDDW